MGNALVVGAVVRIGSVLAQDWHAVLAEKVDPLRAAAST